MDDWFVPIPDIFAKSALRPPKTAGAL